LTLRYQIPKIWLLRHCALKNNNFNNTLSSALINGNFGTNQLLFSFTRTDQGLYASNYIAFAHTITLTTDYRSGNIPSRKQINSDFLQHIPSLGWITKPGGPGWQIDVTSALFTGDLSTAALSDPALDNIRNISEISLELWQSNLNRCYHTELGGANYNSSPKDALALRYGHLPPIVSNTSTLTSDTAFNLKRALSSRMTTSPADYPSLLALDSEYGPFSAGSAQGSLIGYNNTSSTDVSHSDHLFNQSNTRNTGYYFPKLDLIVHADVLDARTTTTSLIDHRTPDIAFQAGRLDSVGYSIPEGSIVAVNRIERENWVPLSGPLKGSSYRSFLPVSEIEGTATNPVRIYSINAFTCEWLPTTYLFKSVYKDRKREYLRLPVPTRFDYDGILAKSIDNPILTNFHASHMQYGICAKNAKVSDAVITNSVIAINLSLEDSSSVTSFEGSLEVGSSDTIFSNLLIYDCIKALGTFSIAQVGSGLKFHHLTVFRCEYGVFTKTDQFTSAPVGQVEIYNSIFTLNKIVYSTDQINSEDPAYKSDSLLENNNVLWLNLTECYPLGIHTLGNANTSHTAGNKDANTSNPFFCSPNIFCGVGEYSTAANPALVDADDRALIHNWFNLDHVQPVKLHPPSHAASVTALDRSGDALGILAPYSPDEVVGHSNVADYGGITNTYDALNSFAFTLPLPWRVVIWVCRLECRQHVCCLRFLSPWDSSTS
jgi:hypothetical protein